MFQKKNTFKSYLFTFVGGVLGGGTGYVIGNGMQNQEHANEQTQAQVQSQQQEIENQRQQIQQMKSQSETE